MSQTAILCSVVARCLLPWTELSSQVKAKSSGGVWGLVYEVFTFYCVIVPALLDMVVDRYNCVQFLEFIQVGLPV